MQQNSSAPAVVVTHAERAADSGWFSADQCDALFAAVLAHDDIHLDAEPPTSIHLNYSQQQLQQCYRISRQLWDSGVDRAAFAALATRVHLDHAASSDDGIAFKHVRAKFKQLRCAYVVCGAQHKYPMVFHWMTVAMGHLQDAIKTSRPIAAGRWSVLLCLALRKLPFALMLRQMDQFRPATTASFAAWVGQQFDSIRATLAKDGVTAWEFHRARIVISRMTALYDNLTVLYPSAYHHSVSRYLSTLNGLMGTKHDELLVRDINGLQDYRTDKFSIADDIRQRLSALINALSMPARELHSKAA